MSTIRNVHRLIALFVIHFLGQQCETASGQICLQGSDGCIHENYSKDMDDIRLLLLGKTGSGKSTTGNAILGDEVFTISSSFSSETKRCTIERNSRNGTMIEIVDTPGLFDTNMTNEETISIIIRTVIGMYPGPDALLYVIKFDRFTEEEAKTYNLFKQFFDDALSNYTILVFTTGNQLHGQNKSLEDELKAAPKDLQNLVKECNNRIVALSNISPEKEKGVAEIMEIVKKLRHKNKEIPYSSNKYRDVLQIIQEDISRTTQEVNSRFNYKQTKLEEEGILEKMRREAAELWEWMLGIFQ